MSASAYTRLGPERVLLMNNDSNALCEISHQGYNDTDNTQPYYWVHTGENAASFPVTTKNLKNGTDHKYYNADGTLLWHLVQCRAGSSTVKSQATRSYIPWSATAESINSGGTYNITAVAEVGSVTMRNTTDACIYSPYYAEGVGGFYFDAVNSYNNATPDITVEYATNVLETALADTRLEDAEKYDQFDWKALPCEKLKIVKNGTAFSVESLTPALTLIRLDSNVREDGIFFRIRADVHELLNGYRGPIRFRIRRLSAASGAIDSAGLIQIDNIIASYPPSTAELNCYGVYNETLGGKEAAGWVGAFSPARLGMKQQGIRAGAYCTYRMEDAIGATAADFSLSEGKIHYRWRYLNQAVGEWESADLDFVRDDAGNGALVSAAPFDIDFRQGDLEYYFTAKQQAPDYEPVDFAGTGMDKPFREDGIYGIGEIELRGMEGALASQGEELFTRLRLGESRYSAMKLVGTVTTNQAGAYPPETELFRDETAAFELVDDNTWRLSYHIPREMAGEKLRFHLEGTVMEHHSEDMPFPFTEQTRKWGMAEAEITAAMLPYSGEAGGTGSTDTLIVLPEDSTHLVFEFKDHNSAVTIMRGAYQNFNTWTDALEGFRGSITGEALTNGVPGSSGVSDAKKLYAASFSNWEDSARTYSVWQETFDRPIIWRSNKGNGIWQPFTDDATPNGWTAANAMFVPAQRGTPTGLALQLQGKGYGSVSLDKYGESSMPRGVGDVICKARLAQSYEFEDFAIYLDGAALQNYAVSAKLTMSRAYDPARPNDPPDISPSRPCVSLVGYYRPRKGCYELRFTRADATNGQIRVEAELYKWTVQGRAIQPVRLTGAFLDEKGINENILIPKSESERLSGWTAALLQIQSLTGGGNKITCKVSSQRNSSTISSDNSNLVELFEFTDSTDPLAKGTYGVGSRDCTAGFGRILHHAVRDDGTVDLKGTDEASGTAVLCLPSQAADWSLEYGNRWRLMEAGDSAFGQSGLCSKLPEDQTLKLLTAAIGAGGTGTTGWTDTGLSAVISSFGDQEVILNPKLLETSQVRLQTGPSPAEVVVSELSVGSWRGEDYPNISQDYGQNKQWVYTGSWIETALRGRQELPPPQPAGTNGWYIAFNTKNSRTTTYNLTAVADLIVDRVLVVGGGGAGGAKMGGGGAGGQVNERIWEDEPYIIPKGASVTITVGRGGDNPAKLNGATGRAGRPGDSSQFLVHGILSGVTLTADGGGGGEGWGESSDNLVKRVNSGGASNRRNGKASTNSAIGFKGGNAADGRGGGGAGASEAGGNFVPGYTSAETNQLGNANTTGAWYAEGGRGGAGKASDITGEIVYYGGGGGGGAGAGANETNYSGAGRGKGGEGGLGGGGRGSDVRPQNCRDVITAENGVDGLGGGGGGGTWWRASEPNVYEGDRGGRGGDGVVILRVRTSSNIVRMQPAKVERFSDSTLGITDQRKPSGLRSPFLSNGISMVNFSWINADPNAILQVQISTNFTDAAGVYRRTMSLSEADWTTVDEVAFSNRTDLASGTHTTYLSLREHLVGGRLETVKGVMRVILKPEVIEKYYQSQSTATPLPEDYGKVTLTRILCYDEPPLDMRSWWGWNVHTRGWNHTDCPWSYLCDSPDGLSLALNFSPLESENNSDAALGIGIAPEERVEDFLHNNPFVQSPILANGVGQVSFSARLFDTNAAAAPAIATLYLAKAPNTYQIEHPEAWEAVTNFVIDTHEYKDFIWKTSNDKVLWKAARLAVAGARHGRNGAAAPWESPSIAGVAATPRQRVFIDEMTVAEPVAPRVYFSNIRPFRTGLTDEEMTPIADISSESQQPITGESWGMQATVTSPQLDELLDKNSVRVFVAFFKGISPWGYERWKDDPSKHVIELVRMGDTMTFRSHPSRPESIMQPVVDVNTVYQYFVWAEYADIAGEPGFHEMGRGEWQRPDWYRPTDYNQDFGSELNYAGYTIFDSISPRRAWINEINYNDNDNGRSDSQFIEIAVPQGADLRGWKIRVTGGSLTGTEIAEFGVGEALGQSGPVVVNGVNDAEGIAFTNHYTFVSLRSPETKLAGKLPKAHGTWKNTGGTIPEMQQGEFDFIYTYGIQLIRPSRIIEHEVVVDAKDFFGTPDNPNQLSTGTGLQKRLKQRDGADSSWFYAGKEMATESGDPAMRTLGVYRSHGEDSSCWSSAMRETASKARLNETMDGTPQNVDQGWFLLPNGTDVWVFAVVTGGNLTQEIAGKSTTAATLVLSQGSSTSIVYRTAPWFQIGGVTTNGEAVADAAGKASRRENHEWVLRLDNIRETLNINAWAAPDATLSTDHGLDPSDKYFDAIMQWLQGFGDTTDIYKVGYYGMNGLKIGDLGVKEMYWLDIPPNAKAAADNSNAWRFYGGMGRFPWVTARVVSPMSVTPPQGEDGWNSSAIEQLMVSNINASGQWVMSSNVRIRVSMMITNTVTGEAHPPVVLRGWKPGSKSTDEEYSSTSDWTAVTFRITGALQVPGLSQKYTPLRWFRFGPESFDPSNFMTTVDIPDPFTTSSPAFSEGWLPSRGSNVFWKWQIEDSETPPIAIDILKYYSATNKPPPITP